YAVRVTIAEVSRALGMRANFGATAFPGFAQEACAGAVEIVSTRPGDPPGTGDGPTTKELIKATASVPSGGTPTAEARRFVRPIVSALPGKTFVVLATDGGPNCGDPNATCAIDQCQPNIDGYPQCANVNCCAGPGEGVNCLDSAATLAGVTALKEAGI